jgi:pachytene checkpoint protein 2
MNFAAIRAVNAVLTQLDQLKSRRNVLILTTSNITGAIDVAFVDRADIKQFIGPPGLLARYSVFRSCILELQKRRVLADSTPLFEAQAYHSGDTGAGCSYLLMECAKKSEGMSGRALRKLPALAHALHTQINTTESFLQALWRTIEVEIENRSLLTA